MFWVDNLGKNRKWINDYKEIVEKCKNRDVVLIEFYNKVGA